MEIRLGRSKALKVATFTTVIVAAITSRLKKIDASYHVVIPMIKGLPKQSMVLAEQRFTLNKADLTEYRCTLDDRVMKDVTRALRSAERDDTSIYHRNRKK